MLAEVVSQLAIVVQHPGRVALETFHFHAVQARRSMFLHGKESEG